MNFDHAPGRYHRSGPKRTLDRDELLAERARLWTEPRSAARSAALRRVSIRLDRIDKRSLWRS